MVRTSKISVLWIGLFFLLPIQAICQSTEGQKLIDILDALEQKFSVSFSYADEDLGSEILTPPSPAFNLEQALNYLSSQTDLEFHFLDDNFIAIRKKQTRTLCGYVKDFESNLALANATVLTNSKIILTDSTGYFEIEGVTLTNNSEIIIRYVGYQPIKMKTENFKQDCMDIELHPQTSVLKEVTVTNYPVPGINKLAEGSLEVNTRDLNILPGLIQPDVLVTIQALPGVQSIDESVAQINIRGGSTDQTLLLWNGIRMYQYGHFFGLISATNPYMTKKVSVVKNGTSATIGGGVSGIVDIQSVDTSEEFEGEVGISMLDADFIVKTPLTSTSQITASARSSINGLFTSPTYNQYFDRAFRNTEVLQNSSVDSLIESNQSLNYYDWSLTYSNQFSKKSQFEINMLNTVNALEYEENELLNGTLTSRTSSLDNNSFLAGLQFGHKVNTDMKLSLNSFVSSYTLSTINVDILNDQRLQQENEVLDFSTDVKIQHTISPRFEFSYGYQFNEKGISSLDDINNPLFRRFVKEVLRTHSIYGESIVITPDYNTNIRVGFRGNYYDKLERLLLEPRLSLNHRINKDLMFEFLAESKSQASTQIVDLQNDFLGVVKRQWRLSNGEDIPLLVSNQISSGVYYAKGDGLLSLAGYYKVVKGLSSQSQEFQNQFEFARATGSYRVKGIEVLAKKEFGSMASWLSYHFSHNTYRFRDLFDNDFPSNIEINHYVNTGFSYTKNKLEISAGIAWFTGRPFTQPQSPLPDENNEIVYESPNSSNLPKYFRFDLSSKYNFTFGNNTKAQLGFSIWNMTNQTNLLSTFYRLDENNTIERFNQQGLGVTPNLSARVWF